MAKVVTARGPLNSSERLRDKPGTMIDRITRAVSGELCCHVDRAGCAPRLG